MPFGILRHDFIKIVRRVSDELLKIKSESQVDISSHFKIHSQHFIHELRKHQSQIYPILIGSCNKDIHLVSIYVGYQVN